MSDQPTLLQEKYPPLDDGSADVEDAADMWALIQEAKNQGYLVPVEPTDRICDAHSTKMGEGDTLCWDGLGEHSFPCVVVDVVRIGEPA